MNYNLHLNIIKKLNDIVIPYHIYYLEIDPEFKLSKIFYNYKYDSHGFLIELNDKKIFNTPIRYAKDLLVIHRLSIIDGIQRSYNLLNNLDINLLK